MSQQILDLNELQELKEQFKLMDAKLEKQRIINEMMLEKSMKENLSHIERWYQYRLRVCSISAPLVSFIFLLKYHDQGIAYWGFCIMIMAVALLELYLDRRSYHALDISNLPNLSMTQATENVIRHKKYRSLITSKFITRFLPIQHFVMLKHNTNWCSSGNNLFATNSTFIDNF